MLIIVFYNILIGKEAIFTQCRQPFTESDWRYRKFQMKSVVAAKEISKDQVTRKEDLIIRLDLEWGLYLI